MGDSSIYTSKETDTNQLQFAYRKVFERAPSSLTLSKTKGNYANELIFYCQIMYFFWFFLGFLNTSSSRLDELFMKRDPS